MTPWKATLCLTYVCNLRCGICSIWKRRPRDEFSFDEWRTFLTRAPRFRWIDLTGGEPTIRPDFHEILAEAAAIHRPWLLHFPTNGSFPDRLRAVAEPAKRARIAVTVSIDGAREVHDRMRGVPGSFDLAVESLRILRAIPGVKAVAGMTISAENENGVEDAVHDIEARVPGFRESDLHVNLAQISEHYYGNSPADFRQARAFPKTRARFWPPAEFAASLLERRFQELVPKFIETGRTPIPCRSLAASVFVAPNGLVYPCISDQRVVGALREHDLRLENVLATERARELREEIRGGSCAQCWTPCEAFPTIIDGWIRRDTERTTC